MNVFKLNQRVFRCIASSYSSPPAVADEVVKFSLASAPLRRGIFRIPKKPSNSIIFLVSFLSYLTFKCHKWASTKALKVIRFRNIGPKTLKFRSKVAYKY